MARDDVSSPISSGRLHDTPQVTSHTGQAGAGNPLQGGSRAAVKRHAHRARRPRLWLIPNKVEVRGIAKAGSQGRPKIAQEAGARLLCLRRCPDELPCLSPRACLDAGYMSVG